MSHKPHFDKETDETLLINFTNYKWSNYPIVNVKFLNYKK